MAIHICSNCGHQEHIFGAGGGERIAHAYQTELLGSLPLDLSIRVDADAGKPSVAADPDSVISQHYRAIARNLLEKVSAATTQANNLPDIEIADD
jgi:ATP-binding protein involved in chromosome partitioning